MARSQNKHSIHRAQPTHRFVNTAANPTTKQTAKKTKDEDRLHKLFRFRRMKGKVVEDVLFSSASDYHAVTLLFQDKTSLNLVIDQGFSVHADYSDRKPDTPRLLKTWPLMHSVRFRDEIES